MLLRKTIDWRFNISVKKQNVLVKMWQQIHQVSSQYLYIAFERLLSDALFMRSCQQKMECIHKEAKRTEKKKKKMNKKKNEEEKEREWRRKISWEKPHATLLMRCFARGSWAMDEQNTYVREKQTSCLSRKNYVVRMFENKIILLNCLQKYFLRTRMCDVISQEELQTILMSHCCDGLTEV